jgi:hypothetical protein
MQSALAGGGDGITSDTTCGDTIWRCCWYEQLQHTTAATQYIIYLAAKPKSF